MSVRPARRAAASRRQVIQSDSEDDLIQNSQSTPIISKPEVKRSHVGSRASFDNDYTPAQPSLRTSILDNPADVDTPVSAKRRAPLSEFRKSRTQAQAPRDSASRKQTLESHTKNGNYEARMHLHSSQKENLSPNVLKLPKKIDMSVSLVGDTVIEQSPISTGLPALDTSTADAGSVAVSVASEPKTRIVISKLVLENFKSYAGTQRIGPFHKSFSAVVGPNGSGKSNVIDSLLFVFGFRASKMRQGKVSALIHNSSAHPDLGHCAVEVHFETIYDDDDDPQAYRVCPNSAIVIARKAFKNNSSKYTINGRESSFTEVTNLLRDRGIDLDHKRFLILQGEVESIAQMRPKAANEHDDGLLEYLEDIIGTSKYKAPIEGALERMEALNVICQEKLSRVEIVEKERVRLEEQKDIAVAQIVGENNLSIQKSALYQLYSSECSANLCITKDVITELEAELNSGAESHKGSEELVKELELKHKSALKHCEELNCLLAKYASNAAHSEKAMVQIQEKAKHLSAKQKKLTKSNAASQHALRESSLQISQYQSEITKLACELQTLDSNLAKEDKELVKIRLSLRDKTQKFTDEIESKQKLRQPWDAQILAKRSALQIAQSELEILVQKSGQAQRDLELGREQLRVLEEEAQTKANEIQDIDLEISQTTDTISSVKKALIDLQGREALAKRQFLEARQKADEAKSNFAADRSHGDVLTGLTRLRDSGRVSGFHGRLGDLGKIDAKYDVAISTACPALNNIVVDSVDVGQICIDHLRKNNLGRAIFILLDRLPKRDLKQITTPEDVPRLFDLIQLRDSRFGPAFYSVLQNTLVAKDLDQANRIAYGKTRWRVVTLDGQLIDKSGTMSGGGAKASSGGMSSKFAGTESAGSVAKLESVSQAKEADIDTLSSEISNLEAQLAEMVVTLPKLDTRKSRLSLDLTAMARQRSDLRKSIKEIQAQIASGPVDSSRAATIERTIVSLQDDISRLTEETASIETDIKSLQEKVLEIGGIKLRTQKSKVDGLRDQMEALAMRSETSGISLTKAEKDVKKGETTLSSGQTELASITEEIAALDEELAQLAKNGDDNKEMENTKYALEDSTAQMKQLKADLEHEREGKNAFRARELEIRNKLEEHRKRHTEDTKKLSHWQEKQSKLIIQELAACYCAEDSPMQEIVILSQDELESLDKTELKASISKLEEQTQNVRIETGVLEEYARRCEEHAERLSAMEEAVLERDTARSTAEDLRRRRLTEFMAGFNLISMRLKEMYQMITMGGNAELELVDSLDPFSEGILFSVMPPKKSWKNISNLSGGEKTLSSLALVFALHHYKPTPLYVMDEIDAALDFRNVSIVANYIKDRTKNAQFIVISLRNNMFELSARLVGIYKTNNMTKSIAIENTELVVQRNQSTQG